MTIEIKVPVLGESITEATVGRWFKKPGDAVKVDEPLVELETDKVTVEVPAPASGVLKDILAENGATVAIGALLGALSEGGAAAAASAAPAKSATKASPAAKEPARSAPAAASKPAAAAATPPPAPAARKIMAEAGLAAADIEGSGRRGQILKPDARQAPAAVHHQPLCPDKWPAETRCQNSARTRPED